jgi:hypothetical protein
MSVITFVEGTTLKQSEWIERLQIVESEFRSLLQYRLIALEDSGEYVLRLVGIVVFKRTLLFAQPKFGDVCPLALHDVLRMLRVYFRRSVHRRPYVDKIRDAEYGNSEVLREFDAALGLRDWFYVHGAYRHEQGGTSEHGRPHWVKTIAKRSPLLMQGSVVYPSVVAERRERIFNDLSAFQVGVTRLLLERYALEVPSALVEAEHAAGSAIADWPLREDRRTYFLRRLAIEQGAAFRTDTLRLLKLLQATLESRLAREAPQPQIYGTTAFYSVWEDACSVAFGAAEGLDPADQIGQPVWWTRDSKGVKTRFDARQVPDTIVVRGDWQVVIDAKYYYRFPDARPGGPDIIKQLYYMESLRSSPKNLLSVFILPLPEAIKPTFLGYTTIDGSARSFGNVEAWGLDPKVILSRYIATSPNSDGELIDPIIAERSSVAKLIGESPPDVGG